MSVSGFVNEPICDYSIPENEQAVRDAVAALHGRLGQTRGAIIDGQDVHTERSLASTSPARPDLEVGRIASCSRGDVDRAVKAAGAAFAPWSRRSPVARAETLVRLAGLLRTHRFELLALMSMEIGKDWYEADADIAEGIDFCEYYARLATTHFQERSLVRMAGEDNRYFYIPLGVGVVISPWNFPVAILAGMTAAAVVSGNTVLVKPSSDTPIVAHRLVELAREAGIPDGVINLVPGSGSEIGDYLVTHPDVRFVAFTGSADVGLRINELIARPDPRRRWMTRYVSEMGGKDAIVVDETADLDSASSGVVRSAFGFQGQKCSACSRLIVHRDVKAKLLDLVVEKAKKLPADDPWADPCVFTGPVASAKAFETIGKAIEVGRRDARLVLGGHALDRPGYFIAPTIFDQVKAGSFLEQEEIFGPVLSVVEVSDFDEALSVANDTRYGLTGALYSARSERLARAASDFFCGNLYLNRGCTGAMVGVHPFGGFNLSGTDSKAGGPDYLLNFTQGKTVSERVTVHRPAGLGV
jgi:1-pyrroline-5-carboxylate dehydrogenase